MAVSPEKLHGLGIALILAGIVVVLVSITLLFIKSIKGEGKVKGGGAIIIGPFPIVFGTDKELLKTVLWLALVLTLVLIAAMVIFHMLPK
jgi:uncharacterized protein (TIGR00304 family)